MVRPIVGEAGRFKDGGGLVEAEEGAGGDPHNEPFFEPVRGQLPLPGVTCHTTCIGITDPIVEFAANST